VLGAKISDKRRHLGLHQSVEDPDSWPGGKKFPFPILAVFLHAPGPLSPPRLFRSLSVCCVCSGNGMRLPISLSTSCVTYLASSVLRGRHAAAAGADARWVAVKWRALARLPNCR